jgi:hypothetical protein
MPKLKNEVPEKRISATGKRVGEKFAGKRKCTSIIANNTIKDVMRIVL